MAKKNWIQGAIKHPGACTPMSKSTCTPRRKALAMRFKHGDLHAANMRKKRKMTMPRKDANGYY